MATVAHRPLDRSEVLARRAISLVATAWDLGLTAAVQDDPRAARRLLREAGVRRSAVRAAVLDLQHRPQDGWPNAWTLAVLAETVHLNQLLGRLGQSVLAEHRAPVLGATDRVHAEAARSSGCERLMVLASARPRIVIDHRYVECSRDLLSAARGLCDDHPHGRAAPTCRDLAVCLIETSHLAVRR